MNQAHDETHYNFLNRAFKRWGELCYDHYKLSIVICSVVMLALISQTLKVRVDISTEAMLRENDMVRVNYREFRKTFGREDIIIISLPTEGKLDNTLLENIRILQEAIETTVPYVGKITSLINARYTYGENDDLIVEDLLENYPDHRWSEESLKDYVLSQHNYLDRIISADGKYTALIIELQTYVTGSDELLTEVHSAETFHALRALLDEKPELKANMTGEPVLLTVTNELTAIDAAFTGIAVLSLMLIFMAFFFRRLSGVILPCIVVYGALLGSIGLMGFFGSPFTMTTSAIVGLILGIGVADAVHILSLFYKHYDEHGDKRTAIVFALAHSAPAVFLTTLTTAIGFLSFVVGDLLSTAELGIYAATTVAFALFYTVTFSPSLIAAFNIKRKDVTKSDNKKITVFLLMCGNFGIKYYRSLSVLSALAFVACIWVASHLNMSQDAIRGFPEDLLERKEHFLMDKQYNGLVNFEVIIDSLEENGVYKKDFVEKLLRAEQHLSNTRIENIHLGKTYSYLDIVREVNKSLNGNDEAYYRVPDETELIAQELLLFELNQADDLYDVIDSKKQRARITLKAKHADGVEYEKMIRSLEKELVDIFGNEHPIVITGVSALVAESVPKAIRTMVKSYIVAGFLIIATLMLMVRSVGMGLISIIPNLLPIAMVMSLMVALDWPLDMSTIMIAAIAMGLVVDDSLHFLYHVKNNFIVTDNIQESIRHTLATVGPALFMTTVIFSAAMSVDHLSDVFSVYVFGVCMSIIAVLALLADIILAPALLTWVYGKKNSKED